MQIWRLVKYKLLRFKDRRIFIGKAGKRKIFDFPRNRNQHTAIKGKTGFGKSALAANLAIQNIDKGTRTLFIDPTQ
jgi:type IV secretory pathway VirB4 component